MAASNKRSIILSISTVTGLVMLTSKSLPTFYTTEGQQLFFYYLNLFSNHVVNSLFLDDLLLRNRLITFHCFVKTLKKSKHVLAGFELVNK